MKILPALTCVLILSCGNVDPYLSPIQKDMTEKLVSILEENKFATESNKWEGYTGFKDPIERKAY
jgi:hypothetical protein